MKQMFADFMTKPLQGSHFRHLRDYIMVRVCSRKPKKEAVSVVKKKNSKKKKHIEESNKNGKSRVRVMAQKVILLRHRSVLGFIVSDNCREFRFYLRLDL